MIRERKPSWRRHPLAVRRLMTIRDELITESRAYHPTDEAHRALNRAARAVGTALRCLRTDEYLPDKE